MELKQILKPNSAVLGKSDLALVIQGRVQGHALKGL